MGFEKKTTPKKPKNSMKKLKYPEKKIHIKISNQWKKKGWYVQNVTEQVQNVGKQNCQICESNKKTVICLNDYTRQELLLHFHHVLHHAPLWDRNWWQPTALIKQSGLWYICHRGKYITSTQKVILFPVTLIIFLPLIPLTTVHPSCRWLLCRRWRSLTNIRSAVTHN